MTDYLEEHLGNAGALLERIRRLEQSVSGLSGRAVLSEKAKKSDNFAEKAGDTEEKSENVSRLKKGVYNTETEVNRIKEIVDNLDIDLEIREKEQDISVNRKIRSDDNGENPGQAETASEPEETEARTNTERAENRSELSAQLEELDRVAAALTTLIPAGRETARGGWSAGGRTGGYPISLPGPQSIAVDPNLIAVPGEVWSALGTPAGADPAYGGTRSWAEQADRIFRRDSRRYDGGFYLY